MLSLFIMEDKDTIFYCILLFKGFLELKSAELIIKLFVFFSVFSNKIESPTQQIYTRNYLLFLFFSKNNKIERIIC